MQVSYNEYIEWNRVYLLQLVVLQLNTLSEMETHGLAGW